MAQATLKEIAYVKLKELISTSNYLPGSQLREQELCNLLNIGRTPMREALLQLASESLVEINPRTGARVAKFSIADILNAYEVRLWIEPNAGEKAAKCITGEMLDRLRGILDEMPIHPEYHNEWIKIRELDSKFHELILQSAGNTLAATLVIRARVITDKAIFFVPPGRYDLSRYEHEEIFKALMEHDSSRVKKIMKEHIIAASSRFNQK